jgi:hypothetical protein
MLGASFIPSKRMEIIASGVVRMVGQCCLAEEVLDKTKGCAER